MTYLELSELILQEVKKPLTASEIWDFAVSKNYDKKLNSTGKTPWATLSAILHLDLKNNSDTIFSAVGKRPRRLYLKNKTLFKDIEKAENEADDVIIKKKSNYLEKDLHPFLSHFANLHLNCYTKTINHSKSTKKEFGEWVHPDIVGCYFPIDEWNSEVLELSSAVGNTSLTIFSFELKKELNLSKLRESFFQAVSNSSWANESYLVAAEISNNDDFLKELQRLSSSFGIGIIKIDTNDPLSSEILMPATTKERLDWETINKDFKEFLKRIKIDLTSNEIRKEKYDKIYEEEQLIKMIKAKHR